MKRRKVNDNEYVSIKEIWGRPEKKNPVKIKNQEPEKNQLPPNKKRKGEINKETDSYERNEKNWNEIETTEQEEKTNQINNINTTNTTMNNNKQEKWTKLCENYCSLW